MKYVAGAIAAIAVASAHADISPMPPPPNDGVCIALCALCVFVCGVVVLMSLRRRIGGHGGARKVVSLAAAKGGGRVTVKKGVHHCRTLYLKSGVELHLEEGAVIKGGTKPEDYDDALPLD